MKNQTEVVAGGFVVSALGGVVQSAPGEPAVPVGIMLAAEAPKSKPLVPNGKGHARQACEPVGLFVQIGEGPGASRWLIPFHALASAADMARRESSGTALREWAVPPASPNFDDRPPALGVDELLERQARETVPPAPGLVPISEVGRRAAREAERESLRFLRELAASPSAVVLSIPPFPPPAFDPAAPEGEWYDGGVMDPG